MRNQFLSISLWVIFSFFFLQTVHAQDVTFQRLFPATDRQTFNLGSAPADAGGFYMLNVFAENNGNDPAINVTKHDHKGDIDWSYDYIFDNPLFLVDYRRIEISNIGNDTVVISGIKYDINGFGDGAYIIKIEPQNGEIVYSGEVNNASGLPSPSIWPQVLRGPDEQIYFSNTYAAADSTLYLHVQNFNRNFEPDTGRSFVALDGDGMPVFTAVLESDLTVDSQLVLGLLAAESELLEQIGIMILDTALNQIAGHQYYIDSIPYQTMQIFGLETLPDSSLVVMGSYIDLTTMLFNGFVFRADSTGQVMWARNIDAPSATSFASPNALLYTNNDEILITGKSVDLLDGTVRDYALFLDTEGNVLRQVQYESENSFFLDLGSGLILLSGDLHNSSDQSVLYSTAGLDLNMGVRFSPLAVKMDGDGAAVCEDTLDAKMINEITILRDTLVFSDAFVVAFDTTTIEKELFDNHDVPVLTLLDTLFCPQDPVQVTLNATVMNADSYLWSTGDTTATLFVDEEGEYQVTVTLNDRICYMLCDTSVISVREFPMASIIPDQTVPCQVNLIAQSSTDIDSLIWSTGDRTNTIAVTEPGIYSVTITDSCENSAESSITIGEEAFEMVPGIAVEETRLCEFRELTLVATSNFPGASWVWSTGETSDRIDISEPGTYTVSITDICGNTEEASITISDPDLDISFETIIEVGILNAANCSVDLIANTNDAEYPITGYQWSNGDDQNFTNVAAPGTYSVTVTDVCGTSSVAVATVDASLFEGGDLSVNIESNNTCPDTLTLDIGGSPAFIAGFEWSTGESGSTIIINEGGTYSVTVSSTCGDMFTDTYATSDTLIFPNIFFPNSQSHDINRVFKPFISCPEFFTGENYVFEVYNRWGNRVFETTSVGQGWNGNYSGNPAPSGVYMYFAKWMTDDGERSVQGDVTLQR